MKVTKGRLRRPAIPCSMLLFFTALFAKPVSLHAQQLLVNKENRTISVTTSADMTEEADIATVHVGFRVYGPDQTAAYAKGSMVSNEIRKALDASGLPQNAVESEDQGIGAVDQYAIQDWTPAEKAERKFQVNQSWTVKTTAQNAAHVLDVAVKAGANQSGEIEWGVADEDGLKAKAAALALVRAKQVAQQMAQGLNATLGQLVYASNEMPSSPGVPLAARAAPPGAARAMQKVAPLAIDARKVTRSATVYAIFAIE